MGFVGKYEAFVREVLVRPIDQIDVRLAVKTSRELLPDGHALIDTAYLPREGIVEEHRYLELIASGRFPIAEMAANHDLGHYLRLTAYHDSVWEFLVEAAKRVVRMAQADLEVEEFLAALPADISEIVALRARSTNRSRRTRLFKELERRCRKRRYLLPERWIQRRRGASVAERVCQSLEAIGELPSFRLQEPFVTLLGADLAKISSLTGVRTRGIVANARKFAVCVTEA